MQGHVSIRNLMAAVGVVAIGTATLRSASQLWASAVLMLTAGVLATAVLGGLFSGQGRRFWVGFALFGWGYLLIGLGTELGREMLTTVFLDGCYEQFGPWRRGPISIDTPGLGGLASSPPSSGPLLTWGSPQHLRFRRIGHCLFALVAACIGGIIARTFATRPEHPGASPP